MNNSYTNKNLFLNAVKPFCLTLLALIVLTSEILLAIWIISPSTSVKLYKSLGFNGAAVSAQQRKYSKSNSVNDLYNLVLICDEAGDGDKLLNYSSELLSHEKFDSFALAYKNYVLKNTPKDKFYLVASLKNYLVGIRVECLYKQNAEKAFLESVKCLDDNDINSFYFTKYISCVLNDKSLNEAQKVALLKEAGEAKHNNTQVVDLLENRYNEFSSNLEEADLLTLEQLWQTKSVEVTLLGAMEDARLLSAKQDLQNISEILAERLK